MNWGWIGLGGDPNEPREKRWRLLPAGIVLVVVVAGVWITRVTIGVEYAFIWGVAFGPLVVLAVLLRPTSARGLAEVEAADWCLCLRCRYPLMRQAEGGKLLCPECGGSWERGFLERRWRWIYRQAIRSRGRAVSDPPGVGPKASADRSLQDAGPR